MFLSLFLDLQSIGIMLSRQQTTKSLTRLRVSRSLKKGQGGHSEKGHMVRIESFEKGTFCVHARTVRKRQKGCFQYNLEKH